MLLYFQISQLFPFATKTIHINRSTKLLSSVFKTSVLELQLSNRVTQASPELLQTPSNNASHDHSLL